MGRSDPAPEVARWLAEEVAPLTEHWPSPQIVAEAMYRRWPGLSTDQLARAVAIAMEVKLAAMCEEGKGCG